MVKTLTIREDVYKKLVSIKKSGESFSELFDRLAEQEEASSVLRRLRGSVKFDKGEKEAVLVDIYAKRSEKRA